MIRSTNVSCSSRLLWNNIEQSTGASVTATSKAPRIEKAYVAAIGPKSAPAGPVMVNKRADDDDRREKDRPLDLMGRVSDAIDQRSRMIGSMSRDVSIDRLDDDDR